MHREGVTGFKDGRFRKVSLKFCDRGNCNTLLFMFILLGGGGDFESNLFAVFLALKKNGVMQYDDSDSKRGARKLTTVNQNWIFIT